MKSSLAQTIQDAATGAKSSERIFPARETSRKITDELGNDVERDRVLVVLPYSEQFGITEKTSPLLVDGKRRPDPT